MAVRKPNRRRARPKRWDGQRLHARQLRRTDRREQVQLAVYIAGAALVITVFLALAATVARAAVEGELLSVVFSPQTVILSVMTGFGMNAFKRG